MADTLIYLAAFVTLVAIAVATACMAVRRNGRGVGDLIKQLVIAIAIAGLLPFTSYAGATVLHPRTALVELQEKLSRTHSETYDSQDPNQRNQRRDQIETLNAQIRQETRLFYRAMFWVGFPLGLVSMVAGLMLRSVTVGVGLSFGGLCTLVAGCYSYWDDIGDQLRFWSLLIVLAILIAIGLIKFGKPKPTLLIETA